jgi:hypothetical protein
VRAARLISSWWTTALLALSLSAVYVACTFGENTYERWIRFIFHTPSGLALYLGLALNIAAASVRIILTRLRGVDVNAEAIREMDAHAELNVSVDALDDIMKKAGFSVSEKVSSVTVKNAICGRRGRLSFIPGTVMRAGLVILMVAVLLSSHLRKTDEAMIHPAGGAEMFGRQITFGSIDADLDEDLLQVGGKGSFGIGEVSAVLRSPDGAYTVSAGFPERIEGLYYRITHLGYHQPIRIDEFLLEAGLDVLPPGRLHAVELPSGAGTLSFVLEPEKTIKKGLLTGKAYNLKTPLYRVSLKGEGGDGDVVLGPSGIAELVGRSLTLGDHSLYVKVRSVYDPALLWLYAGAVLGLFGLALMPLRFFWYEKRLCALVGDRRIFVGYSEEFYRMWGILKFRKWTEDLPTGSDETPE